MTPTLMSDLPIVEVKRAVGEKDADAFVGEYVPEIEANITEAGIYVDADTKEPFLAYFPMPRDLVIPLRNAVLNIDVSTVARETSKGESWESKSRTFGMAPRLAFRKRESCRVTPLAAEKPIEHSVITSMASVFSEYMQALLPEQYKQDASRMTEIQEDWKIGDQDLWTSGVINKSAAMPYHRDGFNFKTWSVMPVVRKQMLGGHLHFPEYGVTVGCRDGWLLYFPGYKYVHGVTPMRAKTPDAYRYSIVYYALRGMKDCYTYAMETAKGQESRMAREEDMAKVIKGEAEIKVKGKKKK